MSDIESRSGIAYMPSREPFGLEPIDCSSLIEAYVVNSERLLLARDTVAVCRQRLAASTVDYSLYSNRDYSLRSLIESLGCAVPEDFFRKSDDDDPFNDAVDGFLTEVDRMARHAPMLEEGVIL